MAFGSIRLVKRAFCITAVALATWLASTSRGVAQNPAPDYTRDVEPIFAKSCYACHGSKSQQGGLRLDAKATALTGGQSGKVILPGDAAGSLLLKRISSGDDQARMPMGGKPLPPEQIATIKAWIQSGAVWPDASNAPAAEIKKHWAFIPPERPAVPRVVA